MVGLTYYNMEQPPEDTYLEDQEVCDGGTPLLFLDSDTHWRPIGLTSDQFIRLFSAASAGAELLYPNEKYTVLSPLIRAVECMPDFCTAVEECISNNQTIINLIINLGTGKGTKGEPEVEPPVVTTNPVIGQTCDYDALFGACTGIIDIVNQVITDAFEIIEAQSNTLELLNEVFEAIPGFSLLASAMDVANVLQEQLAENYAAEYTLTVRDNLRCGLFCYLKDSCVVDWRTLYEYFGELTAQEVLTIDLEDFAEYFSTGTFSGVEIVYAAYWLVLGAMSFMGDVMGMNSEQFVKLAQAALNDPDPDWSIICDCPQDVVINAFNGIGALDSNFELEPYVGNSGYTEATATYNPTLDQNDDAYNGIVSGWRVSSIMCKFTVPVTWLSVTNVKLTYWTNNTTTGGYGVASVAFYDATMTFISQEYTTVETTTIDVTNIPSNTAYITFMTRSRTTAIPDCNQTFIQVTGVE